MSDIYTLHVHCRPGIVESHDFDFICLTTEMERNKSSFANGVNKVHKQNGWLEGGGGGPHSGLNYVQMLIQIEDEIIEDLKDQKGYLNIARQTAKGEREIYFACKDFPKPSKMSFDIQKVYSYNFWD